MGFRRSLVRIQSPRHPRGHSSEWIEVPFFSETGRLMVAQLPDDSYHGRCERRLSAAGLLLAERTYPPRLEIPPHAHERPYLCAILQGGYTETCAGKVWTCTP